MDIKEVRIERIKRRMTELGLNSRELAKRSGISESGISRILTGEIEPRLKTFVKISDALKVDYIWLMGLNKEEKCLIEDSLRDIIIKQYGSVRKFTIDNAIPYSTMASVFSRGIKNTNIGTLQGICKPLNLSVDDLVDGRINYISTSSSLTEEMNELITLFEKMCTRDKKLFLKMAHAIVEDSDNE